MNNATIFKSLPIATRKAIINQVINVNGLSSYIKGGDLRRYTEGLKTNGTYRKGIFEAVLHQSLTGLI